MFISVLTHITYLYAHVRNTDPLYLALASRIRPAARYVRSTMGSQYAVYGWFVTTTCVT